MSNPQVGDRFVDKYKDIWVYIGHDSVRRERDGNLGGYQNGVGLVEL